MPVFDPASRPSPADAALLHGILHPPRSGATLRRASLAYRPRQRRAQLVRGLAEAAYRERALPLGHLDPARLAVLSDARDLILVHP